MTWGQFAQISAICYLPGTQECRPPDLQLQWMDEFTYPGVYVSPDVARSIPLNLTLVVHSVKTKMKASENLPLSLLGHLNLIEMKIHSKFNYLFHNSPQCIPKSFFSQRNRIFSFFVWGPHPPLLQIIYSYAAYFAGRPGTSRLIQIFYYSPIGHCGLVVETRSVQLCHHNGGRNAAFYGGTY